MITETDRIRTFLTKKTTIMAGLLVIIAVGVFLRTYRFHDWLDFGSDQVNDATRVGAVVRGEVPWPLLGPDMSHSGDGGRATRFHLGPMYYWFEIVSGKVFGDYPDKYAYPDLLFSILSIPLFFVFLKRLFSTRMALSLTGLYATSYYILGFSHSAWNPNSIPFFVLMFLLALHEFVLNGERTAWMWIAALGITLGVGVQLHAILLVLLPATLLFTWVLFMRKERPAWKRWAVMLALALVLNVGQITSEFRSGFANTKVFFGSVGKTGADGQHGFLEKLRDDINCHIQVNAYMLTSIGQDECDFTVIKAMEKPNARVIAAIRDPWFDIDQLLRFVFSLAGYALWIALYRRETEVRKRRFLCIVLIFALLSFFVLLPVDIGLSRYFVHVFFVPLLFLGFLSEYLMQRLDRKYAAASVAMLFLLVFALNTSSLRSLVTEYATMRHGGDNTIVLGEVESMTDFMTAHADGEKQLALATDRRRSNFIKSLAYVADIHGYHVVRENTLKDAPGNLPLFALSGYDETDPHTEVDGFPVDAFASYGYVGLYALRH